VNNRERTHAVLSYQPYDQLPVVHFGYWRELLERWGREGHVDPEAHVTFQDGNEVDVAISTRLGFDFGWYALLHWQWRLFPLLGKQVLEEMPDGKRKVATEDGTIVLEKPGSTSIPFEIDHLLKGRADWETIFKPRLTFCEARILAARTSVGEVRLDFEQKGLAALQALQPEACPHPVGLHCGSLLGVLRDWLGLKGLCYLMADDPPLLDEMIETVTELYYQGIKAILATGAHFDFALFWEDMAYKSGPLINPRMFQRQVGPRYARLTAVLAEYGIRIVSVDCDGLIDKLIPTWLENGVNTMFPIEVGTWGASIAPWRQQYGRGLLGVGGVNKRIFGQDRAAIEAEIERLKPLVDLGGYLPCPDHRLPADAVWENVQYYCERMRRVFG